MRYILILFTLLIFGCSENSNNSKKTSSKTSSSEVFDDREYSLKEMLNGWSSKFIEKIDANYTAQVNF